MSARRSAGWRRLGLWAALLGAAVALGACSTVDELTQGKKIDYKSAGTLPPLDIPPDLAAPDYSQRYALPNGSAATLSTFKAERKAAASKRGNGEVLPNVPDMHIVQDGSERWLVVNNETPEQLWPKIKEFWQANGFLIKTDDPAAGVMQTGWAENRAKIPQGFIRRTLGKVFDDLYSTPYRDMFRTRLEHTPNGKGTEIFISHRGMQEVYVGSPDVDQPLDRTMWEPRPPDPGLEAVFLRRLMVSLGETQERAKEMMADAKSQTPRALLVQNGDVDHLKVLEGFPNAWRRVGLALDRVGFTVEDQNREKGLYYVRYADPDANQHKDTGFLSKLAFWRSSNEKAKPEQYQVQVKQVGKDSIVRVLDAHGTPSKSETARKILSLLNGQLK